MSWLSRFSLAQRALIALMSIVALVFGAIAIPQLKQQLLPTTNPPVVVPVSSAQTNSVSFVAKVVPGKRITLTASTTFGKITQANLFS